MFTLDQASRLCKILEPVAKRHGFLLSIYGSVLREGRGRDIDLLLVPWRFQYNIPACVQEIAQKLKWQVHGDEGDVYRGLMDTESYVVQDPDTGQYLDVQFRHAHERPEPLNRWCS